MIEDVLCLRGIEVTFSPTNIHIKNSYRITDDDEKRAIIKCLFKVNKKLEDVRTKEDIFNEWKAHNILFQHKFQQARTKDVDIEFNQKHFLKVGYWLIAHFLKEKV